MDDFGVGGSFLRSAFASASFVVPLHNASISSPSLNTSAVDDKTGAAIFKMAPAASHRGGNFL